MSEEDTEQSPDNKNPVGPDADEKEPEQVSDEHGDQASSSTNRFFSRLKKRQKMSEEKQEQTSREEGHASQGDNVISHPNTEQAEQLNDVIGDLTGSSTQKILYLLKRPRILMVAILAMAGLAAAVFAVVMLLPAPSAEQSEPISRAIVADTSNPQADKSSTPTISQNIEEGKSDISWQQAREAFRTGHYKRALRTYSTLRSLLPEGPKSEYINSYMKLRIGQCLFRMGDKQGLNSIREAAANWCPSPAVRAVANMELAKMHEDRGNLMRARMRAYLAAGTASALKNHQEFVRQCDFLISRTLIKKAITYHRAEDPVPWSKVEFFDPLVELSLEELDAELVRGGEVMADASMSACIEDSSDDGALTKSSVYCLQVPLLKLFETFATRSDMEVSWSNVSPHARHRQVTLYLPKTKDLRIFEVAAGSVGLIARFTGKAVVIIDPAACESISQLREVVSKEADSVWRRVFLAHPDDSRVAEGHFALALLNEFTQQTLGATQEYELIAERYPSSRVAPSALLRCALLRSELRNYTGARSMLNSLLDRYPQCDEIGRAYSALGEAMMASDLYEKAFRTFKKLYYLEFSADSKQLACRSAGVCKFHMSEYHEAIKWLNEYIKSLGNNTPSDIAGVYMVMAKSYRAIENYAGAVKLFGAAARNSHSEQKYLAMLELAETYRKTNQPCRAVAVMEELPFEELSQQHKFRRLSLTGEIYCSMSLPLAATGLLRNGMSEINSKTHRARLGLKLARCYKQGGKLNMAYEVLTEVLASLPSGDEAHQATYNLAEVLLELGKPKQAAATLKGLLSSSGRDQYKSSGVINCV